MAEDYLKEAVRGGTGEETKGKDERPGWQKKITDIIGYGPKKTTEIGERLGKKKGQKNPSGRGGGCDKGEMVQNRPAQERNAHL